MSTDTSYNTYDKITSIDWNGRYFILTARSEIAGNTFSYAYSFNGISWTKSNFYQNVTTQNPYSTKFLGDKFLITGNIITTSSQDSLINIVDGQFPVAIPANLENTIIYDIERNLEQPHRIVFPKTTTLALGNTIAYSNDQGQSWTNITTSPFSTSVNDAVWNGKMWVAGGTSETDDTIATSLDGVHWTGRGRYIFAFSCNGIDWSPQQKKYVAVGSGIYGVVATSMDGIYWKLPNVELFSSETGANDVKWGGGMWVMVGNTASSGNTIAYSSDGNTWQYAAISFRNAGVRIYYDSVIWTIYGQDPSYNIATSSDGIHWKLSYVSGANRLSLNLPTNGLLPGIPYPLEPCTSVSTVNKYVHNNSDRGCAYIQPISLACGSGSNSLAYSVDGIQWTAVKTSLFSHCNKAVWNGKVWVVVGAGSYWVATSPDGLCWTGQNSAIMTEGYDVAWNGTYFVAVGYNSSAASLATSLDGITWTSVSIGSIFTVRIHAIEWTGFVWLAYGSGTNTTAISSSLDASVWTPTPIPNLCSVDCSNLLIGNISAITTSSFYSDEQITYYTNPENAFDGSVATKWRSLTINIVNGNVSVPNGYIPFYVGDKTTTYDTSLVTEGEWLQVQLINSVVCKNYYMVFKSDEIGNIPQSWTVLGSNDGSEWNLLDKFEYSRYGNIFPMPEENNWRYPFFCATVAIPSNTTAYSYYRFVFNRNFGDNVSANLRVYVSVAEIVLFDGGLQQLDLNIRPIVLKDVILHPTRNLSVDGTIPNIYRITDLSGNLNREGILHLGRYANPALYGLTAEPTATIFDGYNHIVFSASGEIAYLSNAESNTTLNFDNSFNGMVIAGSANSINAACHNRKFILFGDSSGSISYGMLNENVPPTFYPTNASSLFSTINGLASNSGYGFVVTPNTIYLKEDEKLNVVTPKYHDSALSSDTSISFNVYKSI